MKKGLTIVAMNALVIAEATKLKKNATKNELHSLDISILDTTSVNQCIYGQMTGNCFTSRATELIELSCEKVFKRIFHMEKITGELNGSPKGEHRCFYWSPIELFIDSKRNRTNGNNKRLVDFLKDETQTLKLK